MRRKITNTLLREIAPQQKPFRIFDTEIPGFVLRVQPSGTMTYYLEYRNEKGKNATFRLGRHGTLTPIQARRFAAEKAAEVTQGVDVQAEKKATRKREEEQRVRSLGGFLAEKYAPWAVRHLKRGDLAVHRIKVNFEHLFDLDLAEIKPAVLEQWRTQQLEKGKGRGTVNRDISTLRSALSKAVEWDLLDAHPLQKLRPLKQDRIRVIRFLSPAEEQRLRDKLQERDRRIIDERESANLWRQERGYPLMRSLAQFSFGDHLSPMVLLSINTGLRRGEVFSLRWQDVDFERKVLTVTGETSKTGQTRHIPLNKEALQVLQEWKRQSVGGGLIFPGKEGKRLDNVTSSWEKIREAAGVENFRWHDLRHHFASRLVMKGVPLNTVRELLGHTSLNTTLRYAHLAPDHKASAVEVLTT